MKHQKRHLLIFCFFLLLVIILRFSSFLQPIISNDESLYLLMAKSLMEGNAPYTTIWDNKPIGIYVIYSLALLIFGNSVTSILIAAAIAISLTCGLLYLLGNEIEKNIGFLAGILYAIFTLGSGGIYANTEIFFAPFVVSSFYLLFSRIVNSNKQINKSNFLLFLIGLLMGIAFQIKQVILFEFICIVLIIGIDEYFQSIKTGIFSVKEIFKTSILLSCGFILPLGLVCLYFLSKGDFDSYLYANFYANITRIAGETFSLSNFATGFIIQLKSNLLLWVSLLLIPLYLSFSKQNTVAEKRNLTYLLIWLAMAFLGVCSPKSFYVHYFLQLFPPLCLLSSYLLTNITQVAENTNKTKKLIILVLIIAQPLFINVYPIFKVGIQTFYLQDIKKVANWGNNAAIVSDYLRKRVNKDDYIYVTDYETIVYFLVPAKIPTKYVFPDFLISPKLSNVAGVDSLRELDSIIKKQPVYIIRLKPQGILDQQFYIQLDKYLNSYFLEKQFDFHEEFPELKLQPNLPTSVQLYKLKK